MSLLWHFAANLKFSSPTCRAPGGLFFERVTVPSL